MVDKTSLRDLNFKKEEWKLNITAANKRIALNVEYNEDYNWLQEIISEGKKELTRIDEQIKKLEREEKTDCKHKWIYNQIINVFKNTIKYEITCSKCGYMPPEGYIPDERTEGIFDKIDIADALIMTDEKKWEEGELKTLDEIQLYNRNLLRANEMGYINWFREEIKKEAIKWIKDDIQGYPDIYNTVDDLEAIKRFIKHFFDISEEDILE